ncbi:MAG: 1-(5-phosphoribosyl)-5-[(5-phosphoribosylamino)methylideneamino]imidazole-4-carboxamide isomerase [Candidatus Marinimicrobia bacterium]|jgi:phosphoribosylformimino-5-aminoimidazole carboxamide ribotide isomerase|nr:1-(5-phosphoribosyl)-5-[(5-phosphoribosylamino)methylideneamino]imidazole-4-carboxamide isomerase [Candidatus Neomarinimicrobiota bacterium]MDP6455914.1 1-(5-phosphoribosyl)-5-[(5-phosphoribosylamino)methylideneamino]imidazole-4-carboxamide isomerase [Candidatus Neomarinimicrobiota bacterium]MDP6592978.1 1-(5-phosphoribosyl)-5-[(5-phosphoribosylamino)methylideneamino]imidazole-4-carboxamide isomerase [Candidatus Neomarinimicrobiota bacterium]MDP6835936.1 1-(5-phosphoribosyl)-5-[(5-phosphoribo|tara:strand:- start:7434 stop:8156 length:723 start_codon:yes stop_codon:yes gene_type:complete
MDAFRVIPAIDLIDGKCVRLTQGDYETRRVYSDDPVALSRKFLEVGLDLVHLVDLDGARSGHPMNLPVVEAVAATGITVELGGGLRTIHHLRQATESGVEYLILGSRLLSDITVLREWTEHFPHRFVAAIDARDGKLSTHGWEFTTTVDVTEVVEKVESLGFSRIIYTDIQRDGMLSGLNLLQLRSVARSTTLPVVASGGVAGVEDITSVKKLHAAGVTGVIVGKAFYEGKITLEEMSQC